MNYVTRRWIGTAAAFWTSRTTAKCPAGSTNTRQRITNRQVSANQKNTKKVENYKFDRGQRIHSIMKRQMLMMMMMPLLVLSRIPASISRPPFNFTWPTKKASDVEGDLTLGGLMMIHERQENFTCGPVMPQGGIQVGYNSSNNFVQLKKNVL